MAKTFMNITMTSPVSGKRNTMRLRIEPRDMIKYREGATIDEAFPYLPHAERLFIEKGVTPYEQENSQTKNSFDEEE